MRRLLAEPLVHFLGIGLLLTTEALIADAPKKDAGGLQMPGGGGMGGMDM